MSQDNTVVEAEKITTEIKKEPLETIAESTAVQVPIKREENSEEIVKQSNAADETPAEVKVDTGNANDEAKQADDEDEAEAEVILDNEAPPENEDSDDGVQVTIDEVPDLRAKQRPEPRPKAPSIDIEGAAILEIEDSDDKPWRKPGADISDYFNYGFDEDTWKIYCEKQKKTKVIAEDIAASLNHQQHQRQPSHPMHHQHGHHGHHQHHYQANVDHHQPPMRIPTIVSQDRMEPWMPIPPAHTASVGTHESVPPVAPSIPVESRPSGSSSGDRDRDRERERDRRSKRDREGKERDRERTRDRDRDRERDRERRRDRDRGDREKRKKSHSRDRERTKKRKK